MDLLKLAIAAFSATNLMTTFSYLLSASYKKLFKEPVMMNFILEGLNVQLRGKWHKVGGWIAHYAIGLALVIVYESLWRYTIIPFSLISGILFGVCTGIAGIICWRAIYLSEIHNDVSPRSYYIQLFFGHILFAVAVVIAFKIFNYDPLSKINAYL